MKAKDALLFEFRYFYGTAKANIAGMDAEASVVQPSPSGNCANWILGHVVEAHNAAMRLVNEAPAWESESIERVGSGPITSAEEAHDWDDLVSGFLASEERFMAALEAMPDEMLDDGGFTDPFGKAATRGELLNLLGVHGNYHAGQLGVVRRLAGLDGAIRDPRTRT